jgi:TATA-box binding protein (TBP) (component of TFIID and TFIIIB)
MAHSYKKIISDSSFNDSDYLSKAIASKAIESDEEIRSEPNENFILKKKYKNNDSYNMETSLMKTKTEAQTKTKTKAYTKAHTEEQTKAHTKVHTEEQTKAYTKAHTEEQTKAHTEEQTKAHSKTQSKLQSKTQSKLQSKTHSDTPSKRSKKSLSESSSENSTKRTTNLVNSSNQGLNNDDSENIDLITSINKAELEMITKSEAFYDGFDFSRIFDQKYVEKYAFDTYLKMIRADEPGETLVDDVLDDLLPNSPNKQLIRTSDNFQQTPSSNLSSNLNSNSSEMSGGNILNNMQKKGRKPGSGSKSKRAFESSLKKLKSQDVDLSDENVGSMSDLLNERSSDLFCSQTPENPPEEDSDIDLDEQIGMKNNELFNEYKKFNEESFKFLNDNGIKISTITITGKLGTSIYLKNFSRYINLKLTGIASIKFGHRHDTTTNRTIIMTKKKTQKKGRNFFNQATIKMKPLNNAKRNFLNIKLFQNGSIQITGCKEMEDCYNVLDRLMSILKKGKTFNIGEGNMTNIKYVENPDDLIVSNISIDMINSNFKLNYKIDRETLFTILKENHRKHTRETDIGYVECKYSPNHHACVNIKYIYDGAENGGDEKKISIFVFQTGSIIITGAKNIQHIILAYKFIMKIIEKYFKQIRVVVLKPDDIKSDLLLFKELKKIQKEKKYIEMTHEAYLYDGENISSGKTKRAPAKKAYSEDIINTFDEEKEPNADLNELSESDNEPKKKFRTYKTKTKKEMDSCSSHYIEESSESSESLESSESSESLESSESKSKKSNEDSLSKKTKAKNIEHISKDKAHTKLVDDVSRAKLNLFGNQQIMEKKRKCAIILPIPKDQDKNTVNSDLLRGEQKAKKTWSKLETVKELLDEHNKKNSNRMQIPVLMDDEIIYESGYDPEKPIPPSFPFLVNNKLTQLIHNSQNK